VKAVLVTGASGFIGRAACAALAERGWNVRAAVRTRTDLPAEQYVVGDIGAQPRWPLEGVDAVVHLAGIAHELHGRNAESVYHAVNCEATERLARAAAKAGVKRFVFMSSIKVNGERTAIDRPFTSLDVPDPADRYARSKWGAEQALARVASESGLECVVIRPPLVYGAGVKANFLRFVRLVRTGLPLPFASIDNRRSLLYIENLIDLVAACLTHPAAVRVPLLPSDEQVLSTPQLAREIAGAMRRRIVLLPFPTQLLPSKLVESLVVDSASSRTVMGWHAPFTLHAGLADTIAAMNR
jgi:nucleoside-diphosphate-sugar epimerase